MLSRNHIKSLQTSHFSSFPISGTIVRFFLVGTWGRSVRHVTWHSLCHMSWISISKIIFSFLFKYYMFLFNYASPSSGEAYRDRRLTTNFELWVEIFCVPTCFHMRIPKPCLSVCLSVCPSVCPHPEKWYHHSFVNISPTLVIDTSMERSPRVLHHGNPKIWFFFFFKVRNSNFDFWRRAEITLASSISVLH